MDVTETVFLFMLVAFFLANVNGVAVSDSAFVQGGAMLVLWPFQVISSLASAFGFFAPIALFLGGIYLFGYMTKGFGEPLIAVAMVFATIILIAG